jgi:dienelactone hydrolase
LLQNIASYGFLAIAEGLPRGGGGTSNSASMRAAIDWISKVAGTGAYANVDATKIMAAGFSCGGTEAMDNIWDSQVDTIGIISSGLLSNYTAASAWRKPVLFVLGGPSDIAYQNVSIHTTPVSPIFFFFFPLLFHSGRVFTHLPVIITETRWWGSQR